MDITITFGFDCAFCGAPSSVTVEPHEMTEDCRDGCSLMHVEMPVSRMVEYVTRCEACAEDLARARAEAHATRRAESGYAQ